MSDPFEGRTPSANEVSPDPQDPEDAAELQAAGDLDQDELATDPLEGGVEPAEEWSTVAEERPTPREQREGQDIEERLAEERPDTDTWEPDKPLAETREHELDETVDERAATEVADATDEQEYVERNVQADEGAVVEGGYQESTGRSATSAEGIDAADEEASGRAPEEAAERIEDSGR